MKRVLRVPKGWAAAEIHMLAGLAGDQPWVFLPGVYRRWAAHSRLPIRSDDELLKVARGLGLCLKPICNWLSPKDVAYYVGRAPVTIRRWVAKGLLKPKHSMQNRGPYWLGREDLKRLAKKRPDLFAGADPGKLYLLLEKQELIDHIQQKHSVCHGRRKPVQCIETGRIYPSATAADRSLHNAPGAVAQSIMAGTRSGGFYWRFVQ